MALWTQADVDALKVAVASGVQSVTYAGPPSRTVVYQSLAEMRSLLASMQAEVSRSAGGTAYKFFSTSKGL